MEAMNLSQKQQVRSYYQPNILNNRQTNPKFDYGIFNRYKLDDMINLQSEGLIQPKNNSIHLQQQIIELFQKYAKHEIAFISIYGKKGCGKSLLLDKILNLSEILGCNFTAKAQNQKGIYIWNIPFSKGNLKIFLLDIDGYTSQQIDNNYLMLLDLILLLSSSFILLAGPADYSFQQLDTICKHLGRSKSQFSIKKQENENIYLPNHLYCLFRRLSSQNKNYQYVRKMFNEFSFTVIKDIIEQRYAQQSKNEDLKNISMKKYQPKKKILSQEYIKRISSLMRDIYLKISCKSIMNLRFTGANLIKMTINAIQYLNLKGYISIDKVFYKSMKELYIDAYNYHTQLYNESLATYLNKQQPFEVDYLIKAFKNSNEQIFKSYNHLTVNQQLRSTYAQKLERYIDLKEKMILAINKKKSSNKIKQVVPTVKSKPNINQIKQFIQDAKRSPKNLQQVYVTQILPHITTGFKKMEADVKIQEQQKQMRVKVESKLVEKESQLQSIKKNIYVTITETTKNKQFYDKKQKTLNQAINNLKQLINVQATSNYAGQQVDLMKSPQILKKQAQKLSQQSKAKQKIIQQLKSQPENPRSQQKIATLTSQLQEKVTKQKELQLYLTSNLKLQSIPNVKSTSSLSPRKVQSRDYITQNSKIRIIPSPKA